LSKAAPTEHVQGGRPPAADGGYGLRSGVLGHFDSVAQSVATMAPTASAVMTVPLVYSSAGNGTWVSYLLATLCTVLVGLCIARFARDSASPGSLYSYATASLPPVLGSVAAWALLLAYVATGASTIGGFNHYFNVVLGEVVGRSVPDVPIGIACVALSTWVAYRDVKASARLMLYIELVSVGVISSLFLVLLRKHGLHVDAAQLSAKGATLPGIRLGLVLAMFSFVGFESATTLGAEVREPLRTIPRAIIQSVLVSGIFFVVASYTEVLAFPPAAGSLDQSQAPMSVLAKVAGVARLGPFMDACALITMLSCTLACGTASARVLFLMSRNGLVTGRLAAVHEKNRTPHAAVVCTAAAMMLLSAPFSAGNVGGETIYDWMGSLATYGFIVAYALVAIALPIYLRRKGLPTMASVGLAVATVAAMALVLAGTLYPVPEAPKNWLPYLFLLYLAAAAGFNSLQARRPALRPL
jgi:amino acid transporter